MPKQSTFEEILNSDFRWPQPGDMPFVADNAPFKNANIEKDNFARMVLMMDGYKVAADLMVKAAEDDTIMRATLVYPIIFNYRHFLELSLKYHLATYGSTVGVGAEWNTHDLRRLWRKFSEMLERYGTVDPEETDTKVSEILGEFAKIDPNSSSYRYPVDRQGTPLPLDYNDLHLPTLADVMHAVSGYFKGCNGYLSELKDAGPYYT